MPRRGAKQRGPNNARRNFGSLRSVLSRRECNALRKVCRPAREFPRKSPPHLSMERLLSCVSECHEPHPHAVYFSFETAQWEIVKIPIPEQ